MVRAKSGESTWAAVLKSEVQQSPARWSTILECGVSPSDFSADNCLVVLLATACSLLMLIADLDLHLDINRDHQFSVFSGC
mmetsp:Transcript_20994/g.37558  ORF Transcript_20994/g.37558 Transcript_20994/m.37558 type:complete len:81 (-) Transcript_20994:1683-1925(-)